MVRRSTWILLLILLALIGFAWYFQRYQANKAVNTAAVTPTTALNNLYNLAGTQVNDLKISDSSGDKIELYRDTASDKWAISDIPVEKADSFQIESVSGQLFALQAQETLTDTPPLDSIGLITPTYSITMTTAGGSDLITYVGSVTPIGSGYYVRVDAGQVVIVDKTTVDGVIKLLTNPPLLPTPTPEVTTTDTPVPAESETPVATASPAEIGTQTTPTP